MKFSLALLLLLLSRPGYAQEINYEVSGVFSRPIVKEKLLDVHTVKDINPNFPATWISRYFSVEVLAISNGIVLKAISANDTLTTEQKEVLKMADLGTDITIDIKYTPESSTNEDLEEKMINFSYTVLPEKQAEYPGGYELLKQYLKENAISKISSSSAGQIQRAVVKFSIDEDGFAINAHISRSSENESIDQLLLEAVLNMPKWKPAKNSKGISVKQVFEFSIGNNVGC